MPAANPGAQITGLRELARDLKKVDAEFPAALKQMHRDVAEQLILPGVRERLGASFTNVAGGQTHAGGALAETLRVLSQQASAQIAIGGARTPYAAGMIWGSTGKQKRARQFPLRTSPAGFIIYPVIREKSDAIRAAYAAGIDRLLASAGFSDDGEGT